MSKNHALYFVFNGPSQGREGHAMEIFNAQRSYWSDKQKAGEISNFEVVMLSSTANPHTPVGFFLVTGERSKLQDCRWNDEKFLNLHTQTMVTFDGYACIEGYTGEALDSHLERIGKLMQQ
jgi:hypothetical protein